MLDVAEWYRQVQLMKESLNKNGRSRIWAFVMYGWEPDECAAAEEILGIPVTSNENP